MAQVPYPHVEAPRLIRIDGVAAFQVGDPVPLETAERLGLLSGDDHPPIIGATGVASSPTFTDAEIKVAAEAAAAGANTEGAPAPSDPVAPPQASTVAPKQGRAANQSPLSKEN